MSAYIRALEALLIGRGIPLPYRNPPNELPSWAGGENGASALLERLRDAVLYGRDHGPKEMCEEFIGSRLHKAIDAALDAPRVERSSDEGIAAALAAIIALGVDGHSAGDAYEAVYKLRSDTPYAVGRFWPTVTACGSLDDPGVVLTFPDGASAVYVCIATSMAGELWSRINERDTRNVCSHGVSAQDKCSVCSPDNGASSGIESETSEPPETNPCEGAIEMADYSIPLSDETAETLLAVFDSLPATREGEPGQLPEDIDKDGRIALAIEALAKRWNDGGSNDER